MLQPASHLVTWGRRGWSLWRHPLFRAGMRDSLPLAVGVGSWGMVAGAAMVKMGLPVELVVLMSITVSAGTAQVATVPLIVADAPYWLVWATGICVSLRFMVFSFQYRPYFAHLPHYKRVFLAYFTGDSNFNIFVRRYPEPRREAGQLQYALGTAMLTYAIWQSCMIFGAVVGNAIPQNWGLAFAGTMALLALACGQLRDRPAWLAAAVAGFTSVLAYGLPLKLNILVAIAAAVVAGAMARRFIARRSGS